MCWLPPHRKASSRWRAWFTADAWRAQNLQSVSSLKCGSRSGGDPLGANEYASRDFGRGDTPITGLACNSLKCLRWLRPHQPFFITSGRLALRASPQTKISFLHADFVEIHGRPIVGTSDSGNRVLLLRVSVLAQYEVSTRSVVVDRTIGLRTDIRERSDSVTLAVQETLIEPHFHVMLVTKRAKFLARLGSRHKVSSSTLPSRGRCDCGSRLFPQILESGSSSTTITHIFLMRAAFRCQAF
jgi:hypothetical protein